MAYVYILESLRDGKFYIGSTVNLKNRIQQHKAGYTHSTKRFGKLRLAFKQEYKTIREARLIETKLKKLKRKDYLKKIVADGYIKMKI